MIEYDSCLKLDPARRSASRDDVRLNLRPLEFDLLLYLLARAEKPVSALELCAVLSVSRAALTVHLHRLRQALGGPPLLHTLNGAYVLSASRPPDARRVRVTR